MFPKDMSQQHAETRREADRQANNNQRVPLTQVVRADLERLIPSHDKTDLARVLGRKETDVAGAALLPLELALGEAEELGAPGKSARARGTERCPMRMEGQCWQNGGDGGDGGVLVHRLQGLGGWYGKE